MTRIRVLKRRLRFNKVIELKMLDQDVFGLTFFL